MFSALASIMRTYVSKGFHNRSHSHIRRLSAICSCSLYRKARPLTTTTTISAIATAASVNIKTMATSSGVNSSIDLRKLGENNVKQVPSLEAAKEISILLPLLQQNNVRLIAVGLEDFGLDEFVEGKFFQGELFVDIEEATYKQIGYKRFNICTVLLSLFNSKARKAIAKGKEEKMPSNLKGNGLQNGGVLIVTKGGNEILMDFRQDNPADHVENQEILKCLKISDSIGVLDNAGGNSDDEKRKSN